MALSWSSAAGHILGVLALIGFGGFLVYVAVNEAATKVWKRLRLVVRGHRASATVAGWDTEEHPDHATEYTLIVNFTTRLGDELDAVRLELATRSQPRMGAVVKVLYEPLNPSDAIMTDWFDTVVVGFMMVPLGVISGAYFIFLGIRGLMSSFA